MNTFDNNLINIGGEESDEFYRYKMPKINIQITGKGNGIQTVLTNIRDIANAIEHPLEVITKYLSYSLGSNYNSEKNFLTGKHQVEDIQKYIIEYINTFVLCDSCKNPETIFSIEGKKKNIQLFIQCASCGYRTKIMTGGKKEEKTKIISGKANQKLVQFLEKYIKENPMEFSNEKQAYQKESNLNTNNFDDIF